ncbi:MAG: hypothetical protein JW751_06900, partial [Polyangiaceae bacterium]|nr:hypothetical protein [Polyangiaceae bacterium]
MGKTERQLRAGAREYKIGVFPLAASGRARTPGATVGVTKIMADRRSDRILGVYVMVRAASEMIAEAVLAMELGASTEDLQRTIHAHPTLAETTHEAALAADGRALNTVGERGRPPWLTNSGRSAALALASSARGIDGDGAGDPGCLEGRRSGALRPHAGVTLGWAEVGSAQATTPTGATSPTGAMTLTGATAATVASISDGLEGFCTTRLPCRSRKTRAASEVAPPVMNTTRAACSGRDCSSLRRSPELTRVCSGELAQRDRCSGGVDRE